MTDDKPAMFQRSVDTDILVKILGNADVGELVTYAEMSKAISKNVQKSGRSHLESAKRILLNEERKVFDTIRGQGVKLLAPGEVVHKSRSSFDRMRRESGRGMKRLATLSKEEYDELSSDEKIECNSNRSFFGLFDMMSRKSSVKKIEAAVEQNKEVLSIGATMGLFRDNGK